ncbi:MAG TPA: hypothetical protein DCR24_14175 [Bacillus bacterium]|nr:hypothetical protein [Bacillus sp. (in: firmicutes)]
MDKQAKSITIKINGKDRPIVKNNNEENENSNHIYSGDRDEALYETAAAQESVEESFDWVLPDPVEEEIVKEYKFAPKQPKKQKKNIGISVWNKKMSHKNGLYTKIFLTVFFAVLLGTAFGVTILKLVTADTVAEIPVSSKVDAVPEKTPVGDKSLDLNNIAAFVVQNGIFTTEEGAKERVNIITAQGIDAEIFPVSGQYAIYMGTADSIEQAKNIGVAIKEKGIEVFAKPVEIPGGTATGLTTEEVEFLQKAPEMYPILLKGIAETPELLKKIEDFQLLLSKIADKEIKNKNVLKAKASIERASGAFIAYQQSKDEKKLAETRSGLLSFLSAYQSIGQ